MPQTPIARPTPTTPAIRSRTPLALLATAGVCLTLATAHAQSTIEWASPVDGAFGAAGNWLPAVVPGATDTAVLGGVGPYTVFLESTRTIDVLRLPNPDAILMLNPSRDLTVSGLTGDGMVVVSDDASSSVSELRVVEGVTLQGRVLLNGRDAARAILRPTTGAATLGESAVVTGQGRIEGLWTNNGLIHADAPGTLHIDDTLAGGTLRSSGGGELDIGGAELSGVLIEAGPGSLFASTGSTVITDSTIRGTYRIEANDDLTLGAGVVIEEDIVVSDDASSSVSELRVVEGVTLQGRVLLNGRDAARAILRPTTGAATLGESAVVTGQGTVRGSWTCAGTLAPGSGLDGIGLLQPSVAPFAMTPTARVAIDAGGTADDEYDRIDGNSGAIITLDGTLDVNFVDGYVPEPRDQFEIITASMIDGSFASTTIEPVGAIGPAHVVYTGDSVIVVICAADRDADGELTIFDFLAFQNLFDSGDLRADLDQDGQLTIFDFLTYQNRFDAGCG